MKTKTIPFDLEMAKKIQAGEIEGRIKNKRGYAVRLICTDLKGTDRAIVCALDFGQEECVYYYTIDGICMVGSESGVWNLVLEVPDNEPQFKPFDKVLVTMDGWHYWIPSLYRNETPDGKHICIDDLEYDKCIPYEGNENLVCTTDKPKED